MSLRTRVAAVVLVICAGLLAITGSSPTPTRAGMAQQGSGVGALLGDYAPVQVTCMGVPAGTSAHLVVLAVGGNNVDARLEGIELRNSALRYEVEGDEHVDVEPYWLSIEQLHEGDKLPPYSATLSPSDEMALYSSFDWESADGPVKVRTGGYAHLGIRVADATWQEGIHLILTGVEFSSADGAKLHVPLDQQHFLVDDDKDRWRQDGCGPEWEVAAGL